MKNALNNQVGMLGDMFLWLVANLKQGVIYFIKQGGGNHKIAWLYVWKLRLMNLENYFQFLKMFAIGNSACPLGKNNSYSEFKQLKDASCYDVDD